MSLSAQLCDADGQDLPIPPLVSAGHRTDVGDYRGGFGEAVGPVSAEVIHCGDVDRPC